MEDLFSFGQSTYSQSEVHLREIEKVLLTGKPFPYIHRESEFYHHRFYVDERVLIPRPETEFLVDLIISSGRKYEHLLDVGTGSGIILLSLMKAGIARSGTGSDLSPAALEVAKINRRRLRVNSDLVLSDRLKRIPGKFDLIVSNPPYIKSTAHRSLVQSTVDTFEPHQALYLEDSLYEEWFRIFFTDVRDHLLPGGEFWMEGHEAEVTYQKRMLEKMGFQETKVIKDLAGSERFLYGRI